MKNEDIEKYILNHTSPEDDLLFKLYRETHLKFIHPEMISGHYLGKFLEIISKTMKPENILEIGTFTGYSTICLARGLKENGKIHTIESNDELSPIHEKYFEESGLRKKIICYYGNAREIIPDLNIAFDLIYIDGAKKDYPEFYSLVFPKVKANGLIIADNVLWHNNVININACDNKTEAIKIFNDVVQKDQRVENIILPIRDGIMLIYKK